MAANVNTINIIVNNEQPLEETGQNGRVNWEQGENGTIEAMGVGLAPTNARNIAQAKVLARRAAIVDAYRNLAETTQGVRVDSETTMENLAITNDLVRTRVSALVQGAKIVREIPSDDGSYTVIMNINMYGVNSAAQIAFDAMKPAEIAPFPQPDRIPTVTLPGTTSQQPISANYTGVVIVAKDMGLQSTFSPRVYDETGNIVYGNKYIDPDFAIKHGMVDYSNLDAAVKGNSRAGANPLVVNALRVVDHNCNVVISNADAQKILAAHAQNGFLAKCAVVFARK
ncbi:MAG: LPP20 family lipoprotein [Sporomusaceae bacterium]|nr:LPP20 family lipoprotein [Sporomusaceae bacterium]